MNRSTLSNPKTGLEATAIRFLSYRPRFKVEVINRLTKTAREFGLADPLTLINQIVASLEKSGFIDDAKNLESFIHYRLETKLKGPLWIKAYLLRLGLAKAEVESALRRFAPREAQTAAIRHFLAKKLLGRGQNFKIKAKHFRALVTRGFPVSLVASAFDEGPNEAV